MMRETIETIMHQAGPPEKHRFIAGLLRAAAVTYGWGQKFHRIMGQSGASRKRLNCMVISVGNVTVGGTGKTPMVVYLAKWLQKKGVTVAILTRGYGGTAESRGGIVTDGQTVLMTSEDAGDEPVLLAAQLPGIPIVVGKDRFHSGKVAEETFQPDVTLLDDGFQHYGLHRDIDLVLLDGRRPLGNGFLLPRGTLREPPSGLKRADALIMTRADHYDESRWDKIQGRFSAKPLFCARHQPQIVSSSSAPERATVQTLADLKDASVLAFAGIGQNETFFQMIEAAGTRLVARISFPDHFTYETGHLRQIERQADLYKVDTLLTTAKDAVRLPEDWTGSRSLIVLDARIEFENDDFDQFLSCKIEQVRTGSGQSPF